MPDYCDDAQKIADLHLQNSLTKATSLLAAGPGSEKCLDCGEKIPKRRREASPGCERCVSCQQEHEEYLSWRG